MSLQPIGIPQTCHADTSPLSDKIKYHLLYGVSYVFPHVRPLPSYEKLMDKARALIETDVHFGNWKKKSRTYETLEVALYKAQRDAQKTSRERDQLEIKYDLDSVDWRKDDASNWILYYIAITTFWAAAVALGLSLWQFSAHKDEVEGECVAPPLSCDALNMTRDAQNERGTLKRSDYISLGITLVALITLLGNALAIWSNVSDKGYIKMKRVRELRNASTELTKKLYRAEIHRLMDDTVPLSRPQQDEARRFNYWGAVFNNLTISPRNGEMALQNRPIGKVKPKAIRRFLNFVRDKDANIDWSGPVYIGRSTKDQGNEAHRTIKLSYFYAGIALLDRAIRNRDLCESVLISDHLFELIRHYAEVDPLLKSTFADEIDPLLKAAEESKTASNQAEANRLRILARHRAGEVDQQTYQRVHDRASEAANRATEADAAKTAAEETEAIFKSNLESLMVRLRGADKELPTLVARALYLSGTMINTDGWHDVAGLATAQQILEENRTKLKQRLALACRMREIIDTETEEYEDTYGCSHFSDTLLIHRNGELLYKLRAAQKDAEMRPVQDGLVEKLKGLFKEYDKCREKGASTGGESFHDIRCRMRMVEILYTLARIDLASIEQYARQATHTLLRISCDTLAPGAKMERFLTLRDQLETAKRSSLDQTARDLLGIFSLWRRTQQEGLHPAVAAIQPDDEIFSNGLLGIFGLPLEPQLRPLVHQAPQQQQMTLEDGEFRPLRHGFVRLVRPAPQPGGLRRVARGIAGLAADIRARALNPPPAGVPQVPHAIHPAPHRGLRRAIGERAQRAVANIRDRVFGPPNNAIAFAAFDPGDNAIAGPFGQGVIYDASP